MPENKSNPEKKITKEKLNETWKEEEQTSNLSINRQILTIRQLVSE